MHKFFAILLHIFLPNRCMFCGKPVEYDRDLCPFCAEHKPLLDASRCPICGWTECTGHTDDLGIDWLAVPFSYDTGVERAIRDLKFHDNLPNAGKLAAYMAEALRRKGELGQIDWLLPVPMYPPDERKRGYNQSLRLARCLSKELGIPVREDVLKKGRPTAKQHTLHRKERRRNLQGAFFLSDPAAVLGKRVLLVDDVYTTGSTMAECARVLRGQGAALVAGTTAARVQRMEGSGAPAV